MNLEWVHEKKRHKASMIEMPFFPAARELSDQIADSVIILQDPGLKYFSHEKKWS